MNILQTHFLGFTIDFEGEGQIFISRTCNCNISSVCVHGLAVLSSVEADIYFAGGLWTVTTNPARRRWFLHHLYMLSHLREDRS